MFRNLTWAVFLAAVVLVAIAVHYYFWARLVRDPALPPTVRQALTWVLAGLGASLPAAFLAIRFLSPSVSRWITLPIYLWMGLLFLLLCLLLVEDTVRLFVLGALRLTKGPAALGADQRLLVARVVAAVALVGAVGLAALATRNAFAPVIVHPVEVTLRRLPPRLDGLRLVQLSDLHLGPTLGREWLSRVVEQTNQLRPDLIAITGDLADGPVSLLRDTVSPLAGLKAQYGVFFVTGNHEYFQGVEQWLAEIRRLGIRVLRNERVSVGLEGASFDLAGIDDPHGARLAPGHGPDLGRALAGRDAQRELVLLAHQPVAVLEAAALGAGLVLSGHTHGGQIWPMRYLVRLQQPYVRGRVRHGETVLYVSDGTGFWGPPMRLGSRSEIALVTLRAAPAR